MKSLLAILALAVVAGAGYWKFRNPDAGINDIGSQASGQARQLTSALGFSGTDTSRLEADLASSQTRLDETSAALESNQQALEDALQRLAALESRVDETAQQVDQTALQVDQTALQLDETVTKVDQTTARVDETDARLDTTEQALQSASSGFESRESSLVQRLQAIGGKVDQGLAGADRLEPMEERLATLEATISEMDAGFSDATSALTQRVEADLAAQTSATDSALADANSQISARLDSLEATVSGVASSADQSASASDLAEIQQQVAQLQSDIQNSDATLSARLDTALDDRIAGLSESIEEKRKIDADNSTRLLRQSVNRMDNRIKAISAASGEADAALELTTALDDRIDQVENSIAEIEQNPAIQRLERSLSTRLEQTNASIEEIDSSVAAMDSSIKEVRTSIDVVQSTVTGLEDNVLSRVAADAAASSETLQQQLEAEKLKVAGIEAQLENNATQNSDIRETVTTRFADLDKRIGSLESSDTQLAAALPQIQAVEQNSFAADDGAALSRKVQKLETSLASLDDTVVAIRSSAAKADEQSAIGAPAELESEVSRLTQRIDEMDGQLAALTGAPVEDNAEQIRAELKAQITELENRLAQQAQKPDQRLANEVDQLNKKLSELEQERLAAANGAELGKPNEYKIYFGKDSVSIGDEAEKVLKSFISQEQNRASSVSIFGFTDRSGNAAYNQRLALRRANGVRSFLIQQGFDFRKINAVDGLGEDPAASKLDDGQEDANQRTVVLYAYQK